MIGGKVLTQIKMVVADELNLNPLPIFINVYDSPLAIKWANALKDLVSKQYHLEKNYCFLGFAESKRSAEYIVQEINKCIATINGADIGYNIGETFTLSEMLNAGAVGIGQPGLTLNHGKLNRLHRYFEELQGNSAGISNYYTSSSKDVKWAIRQLNLLCHEFESLALSLRKNLYSPEWKRPSQLMCWLNAPRFTLDESDFDSFGINSLYRDFGGVTVGVNKGVGKTHWEVFKDENGASVNELTTTALTKQLIAAGDFDIDWGQSTRGKPWMEHDVSEFSKWLVANGFDPHDKTLTLGHPQVGQVDFEASFGTADYKIVWEKLGSRLNVSQISIDGAVAEYKYHWSDSDFAALQASLL